MTEQGPELSQDQLKEQLDMQLRQAVARWHRLRWILVGVAATILAIAIVIGGIMLGRQQAQIDQGRQLSSAQEKQLAADSKQLAADSRHLEASCQWWFDLSGLPVVPTASGKAPTALGVRLIVDSRVSFRGQGCSGHLPPPGAGLAHWAQVYHLPPP